jgi:hypothetical protein
MGAIAALATTPANITASGSSASTSPMVTSDLNNVSAPSNGTSGVALPPCADAWSIAGYTLPGGMVIPEGFVAPSAITVKNLGPNPINVYPQSGDSLTAGTVIPPWHGCTYSSGGSGRGWLAEPVVQ